MENARFILSYAETRLLFDFRFIDTVRVYRCLYDASDKCYWSIEHRTYVWIRLVHLLNFNGDAPELYYRWRQLRNKYREERKKMRKTGVQSKWPCFKQLTFLDPHISQRPKQHHRRGTILISDPTFQANLIEEVRLYRCLYDICDANYYRFMHRKQVWNDIIEKLNYPGDANCIRHNWKKIRDRYVQERRDLRMSWESGCKAKKSCWNLFTDMEWIDPYLAYRTMHLKKIHNIDEILSNKYEKNIKKRSDCVDHSLDPSTSNSQWSDSLNKWKLFPFLDQSKSPYVHDGILPTSFESMLQNDHNHPMDDDNRMEICAATDLLSLPDSLKSIA